MLTIKFRPLNFLLMLALLAGCTPAGPRALLQGKRLIDQGKFPEAVEKLKTATVLLGTNALACAQAWNYLGVAYHHAGESAAAEKAYQRALALNHDLAEAHYNLGCLCLAADKVEMARSELTAYTLRHGNAPEGFLRLGAVQLRARDLSAAEKSFADALRLSPQNPEALNGLGLVRVQQRRPSEAAQCFSNALKAEPGYSAALLNLAIVEHSYLKDRTLALQKYREYLALKPSPSNVEAVSETVRQLEQDLNPPARPSIANTAPQPLVNALSPKPAVTNGTRIAAGPKPEPTTNVPRPVLPSAAARTSAPVAAASVNPPPVTSAPSTSVEVVKLPSEPTFRPAQDLATTPAATTPSRVETSAPASVPPAPPSSKAAKRGFLERVNPLNLFRTGERPPPRLTPLPSAGSQTESAAARSGQIEPAVATQRVSSTPSFPRYQYKSPPSPAAGDRSGAQRAFDQAVQAQQAHRLLDAVQAYAQATQLDPAFFEAQYNLGLAATDAGNLNYALAAYESALAIRPDSADARYNFALVLKQARYYIDASYELEKLLASHPNEARAHLALANLYAQQLSQPAQARQHYLRLLELDPRNPQAGAIRFWLAANPP
jgi:tetratricopeptide (TPR) repeat protein